MINQNLWFYVISPDINLYNATKFLQKIVWAFHT